ncbi:hypothetical protein ABG768_010166, partial [Culter alburnus]
CAHQGPQFLPCCLDLHDCCDSSWTDSSERSCWVKGYQEQLPSWIKGAGGTGHQ